MNQPNFNKKKNFNFFLSSSHLCRYAVAEHKLHLLEYKKTPDQPVLPWSFQLRTIFERLTAYEQRLCDVKEIFCAANDFFKLEKIEIGGCRGRGLNQKLHDISNEFQSLYNGCIAIDYNPLDPSDERFKCFRQTFQHETHILERKLAQILYEAFEDCNSIEASVKLFEMVGGLAQRHTIATQISMHSERIVQQFNEDIDVVESIFEQHLTALAANETIDLPMVYLYFFPCSAFHFFFFFFFTRLTIRMVANISIPMPLTYAR